MRVAAVASTVACLTVLCAPALCIAANPSNSSAEVTVSPKALLALGAGYAAPGGDPRVRALQRRLRALGLRPGPVDGRYGPLTQAAVERLQRDGGLPVDGIVGPQTRRVLKAEVPPLRLGAGYGQPEESSQVRVAQRRLRALSLRLGPVDGRYGPRTRAAIARFQRTAGQPASGVLSGLTAIALARFHDNDSAGAAGDPRRDNELRQRGRTPASRVEASRTDGRRRRVDGSRPAKKLNESRSRTPTGVDDRTAGSDGRESTSPVPWLLMALLLMTSCGVLVGWLGRRRRSPKTGRVAPGSMRVDRLPSEEMRRWKPSAGRAASSSPAQEPRRYVAAALGYVSLGEGEAVEGQELRDQMATIKTACRERRLLLKEVIRDRERVNDAGPERPGIQYALQRLTAGEESCLVVAELGRLSRSTPKLGYIIELLRRREARLVSVEEGLDTDAKSGGAAADTLVSLCATDGDHRAAESGQPDAVAEPRSAEAANGRRSDVAALIERIRKMRASGTTLQAIANQLNSENVPTLSGGANWWPSAVEAVTGSRTRGAGKEGKLNGNGSSKSTPSRPGRSSRAGEGAR